MPKVTNGMPKMADRTPETADLVSKMGDLMSDVSTLMLWKPNGTSDRVNLMTETASLWHGLPAGKDRTALRPIQSRLFGLRA